MLTSDTKRHIDSARQVLVGKVPNPISQVQEITNALIFKFMDDMDEQAASLGGKRRYFIGEFEKYAWHNIMDPKIGAHEKVILYQEALSRMATNSNLPPIFQDVFRHAYLPFNDGHTLALFLHEINYFDYEHSEELGNAYEYLLSIMGSQGDAGQFRTPRHIIDFIVDVIDPSKDDTVLDPACGTAGFLISAYKHVIEKHDGKDEISGKITHKEKPLTADDRRKLYKNYFGFDISPEMVKLSQVNMFLHGFIEPKIIIHDTLSSEDFWHDRYDIIMANPPFMTPKGGIVPHNKFGIQSNRAELLFVDYIKSHLKPSGKAGIIVPEGVIFQSGNAYKQLRKSLVEDGLYSVVSLPPGVFNPYSGVKTSILFFDNEQAKQQEEIVFVKIMADGFDLGAQRRSNGRSDIPMALDVLRKWKLGEKIENKLVVYTEKSKIAGTADYNLSGDRYRAAIDYTNAKWPIVELGEVCDVCTGNSAPQEKSAFENGKYPFYRTSDVGSVHLSSNLVNVRDWLNDSGVQGLRLFKKGTILFPKSGASTFLNHRAVMGLDGYVSSHLATIKSKDLYANGKYIYYLLTSIDAKTLTPEQAYPSLKTSDIAKIKIPLPPIEIQEQIVSELDGYQNIIDGAKQITQNWKPQISIDTKWPKVKLGHVCSYEGGTQPPKSTFIEHPKEGYIRLLQIRDYKSDDNSVYIPMFERHKTCTANDIMIGRYGPPVFQILRGKAGAYNVALMKCVPDNSKILNDWLYYFLISTPVQKRIISLSERVRQSGVRPSDLDELEIYLPSVENQKQIIEKVEAENQIVEANKKLIEIYTQKIKDVIAKFWD